MIKIILTVITIFAFVISNAQETILTTGNDAISIDGSVNYSIGQITYTTNNANGSVSQGVQQPFEIQTILGQENTNINLEMMVYPNPTSNFLTLKIADLESSNLTFQLFDLQGRLIKNKKIFTNSNIILMENLATSTYFLKIKDNQKIIKTFKIIKK